MNRQLHPNLDQVTYYLYVHMNFVYMNIDIDMNIAKNWWHVQVHTIFCTPTIRLSIYVQYMYV